MHVLSGGIVAVMVLKRKSFRCFGWQIVAAAADVVVKDG